MLMLLPSSHSSPASTYPLPQPTAAHTPLRQAPAAPVPVVQAVPSASGVPAVQTWAAEQVSAPLHSRPSSQSDAASQLQLQSFSQPSPAVALPSSHSSTPVHA